MAQFKKSIILITVIGLAILFSGCVGKQAGTPTPAPTETATPAASAAPTETVTPAASATPVVMATTPAPTAAPFLYGAVYVDARMRQPANMGNGTYELRSLQAKVTDVTNQPISIKAQITSDGQVLEEQSFTLQSGSSFNLANQKPYFINSTNVSLLLMAEGYQPTEYKITTTY